MVKCPECGADMILRETTKFTYKNGDPRKFYGCIRFPHCTAAHGAHPDGKPLGAPANHETKQARINAHAAFDPYWQSLGLSKSDGYRLLGEIMGMTKDQAHIGNFDTEQCETLIRKIEERKSVVMVKGFKGITFSGPDSDTDIGTLVELQKKFPYMEVGVLWSVTKCGTPRFADRKWIEKASELDLNLSLHLCGSVARGMVEGGETPEIPGTPMRVQINCNGMRGTPAWYRAFESIQSRQRHGLEFIIQTCDYSGAYWVGLACGDGGHHCVPLFDKSGGKGQSPTHWPISLPHTHCGYAGGIGPHNVLATAKAVSNVSETFWLDMETSLRVGNKFDLNTVVQVLNLVDPLVEK